MRGTPLPALATLFALSACVPDPGQAPVTTLPTQVAAMPAAPPIPARAPSPPPSADIPAEPETAVYVRPDGTAPCAAATPYRQTGRAHFYGRKFHGRRTASGERFDMHRLTAAHNAMPFGTRARVTNLANNESVVVRITDRHATWSTKAIDLSQAAAEQLGFRGQGIATVQIEALCGQASAEAALPPHKPVAVLMPAAATALPPRKPADQAAPRATSPTTLARTRRALPGR
ncbi:MAG: septal ring lytic transglycosylase RlpA family protein [Alphaproteobacteria bacterium]